MNSIIDFLSSTWAGYYYSSNHHGPRNPSKSKPAPAACPPPNEPPPPWTPVSHHPDFDISRQGSTFRLRLSRVSQGNSLTLSMMRDMTTAFRSFSVDPSCHRVILTGTGRYFCTGMDLKEDSLTSSSTTTTPSSSCSPSSSATRRFTILHDLFQTIDTCPKPTIAVINGPCFGGGVGLATVCDVRIVTSSSSTYFCLSEVKLGLCPATISKYLVREWGVSLARMAMITGRRIDAKVLYDAGVIHSLSDDEREGKDALEEFLGDMRFVAPRAAGLTKMLAIRAAEGVGGGDREFDRIAGEVFEAMMEEGGEAEYGIGEFKRGVRNIIWEDVDRRKREEDEMEEGS